MDEKKLLNAIYTFKYRPAFAGMKNHSVNVAQHLLDEKSLVKWRPAIVLAKNHSVNVVQQLLDAI
ncbi:MAG: hypothetical protein LBD28_05305 [Tannerellaceae bacterium]|nr:hypothetical protein [Tannerellaceae bacterium]